jgi:hypothetical protein
MYLHTSRSSIHRPSPSNGQQAARLVGGPCCRPRPLSTTFRQMDRTTGPIHTTAPLLAVAAGNALQRPAVGWLSIDDASSSAVPKASCMPHHSWDPSAHRRAERVQQGGQGQHGQQQQVHRYWLQVVAGTNYSKLAQQLHGCEGVPTVRSEGGIILLFRRLIIVLSVLFIIVCLVTSIFISHFENLYHDRL